MTFPAPRGRSVLVALLALAPLQVYAGPNTVTPTTDPFDSGPAAQLPGAPGGPPGPPGNNQAPVISNFRAEVRAGGVVIFRGSVSDDQPVAGLSVSIELPNGMLIAGIVDEDGNFAASATLFGSGRFTASAKVTDALGATSATVQTAFMLP